MADTINLPVIGTTKSLYVYVGGALVVGIVGYAWWKKSSEAANVDYVGADPDDYGVGDYNSPLGNTGGNSTGDYTSVDPDAIDTNAEWTNDAVEKLTNAGWESTVVYTALGKYLARQGLTADQVTIVQAAIAASGLPPVGGPYPITDALPDTPSTGTPLLPPPASFHQGDPMAWQNQVQINWSHVDGAAGYVIEVPGGAPGWTSPIVISDGNTHTTTKGGLVRSGTYWARIATKDSAGKQGPWSVLVPFRTKA